LYDPLKSLNIWYFWILTKAKKNSVMLSPPYTNKAYVEVIGTKTTHTYLQSIYCKVKQWIQRAKSYNQIKMCMCVDMRSGMDVYGGYMMGLILLCSLKHISLLELRNIWENLGCIHFFTHGGYRSTHCFLSSHFGATLHPFFRYFGPLSIFFSSFFSLFFFLSSPSLFLQ
jgi:hypothetical protein